MIKETDTGIKYHYCETCEDATAMIHSASTFDEHRGCCIPVIIELLTDKGRTMWAPENPYDDTDNLHAMCAVCGTTIDGTEYCAIAYDQYDPRKERRSE
jgi:hypothetical protein